MPRKKVTADVERALTAPRTVGIGAPSVKDGLSTGSTLLNLACTGRPGVGYLPGKYYFIVGDSKSGKTFLALTCVAEAARNARYEKYRFIYDNAENGAMMDVARLFGKKAAARIEPPATNEDDSPKFSETIEEFYYNVDDAVSDGRPFIYVLDSMDVLSSASEQEKFEENKAAHRKGAEAKGAYGDGKAKINSAGLRKLINPLEKTGSILIVINQTRDNVGTFSFEKKTRSGGHALRFYATVEIWSSVAAPVKQTVAGKSRKVGHVCQLQIKKNRQSGLEWTVQVPILTDLGFDDVSSCVNFLIEEGRWKKSGATVTAKDLEFSGPVAKLVEKIEAEGLEPKLRAVTADLWRDIEEGCKSPGRKRRYE